MRCSFGGKIYYVLLLSLQAAASLRSAGLDQLQLRLGYWPSGDGSANDAVIDWQETQLQL